MDFMYNLRLARHYPNETWQFCFSNKSGNNHKHSMTWWPHSSPSKPLHGQINQVYTSARAACFQPMPGALHGHTSTQRHGHSSLRAQATTHGPGQSSVSLHFPAQLCTLSKPVPLQSYTFQPWCYAKLESRARPSKCPMLPAATQLSLVWLGSSTARARLLPRASCQCVKKLPKPPLTRPRIEIYAQLLDKKCVSRHVHNPETQGTSPW